MFYMTLPQFYTYGGLSKNFNAFALEKSYLFLNREKMVLKNTVSLQH